MAQSRQSSVKDKIADVTECSICTEIFKNPKVLPCVHTFCLHCLEKYGTGKNPGNQMVCPICRNEFIIPNGGLCNLPNNFLIEKMVEIGKLAMTPINKAICDLCPEGEEAVAKMICVDCEEILCERCSKSHKKAKITQNHHVVELGSKLNAQELNLRNSYCKDHPRELIKMYCYKDKEAICLICSAESHDSHKRVNIDKAAGEFKQRLKKDLDNVIKRISDYEEAWQKLVKYKDEFTEQISKTEDSIRDRGNKLKELIDQHTEILIQNLKSAKEKNLKDVEVSKESVERFREMIESFSRYCEELLSRGSPVDICRAADQMHSRANELRKLPVTYSDDYLPRKTVDFHPSSFETLLKQCRSENAVGDISIDELPYAIIECAGEIFGERTRNLVPLPGFITVTTEEPDIFGLDDDPTQKRAKMPCGHVVGPNSMILYCQDLLKKGKYKFCCPAYLCDREWQYFLVRHVACLFPDEIYQFERKFADNYLTKSKGIKRCPGCRIWCFRAPNVLSNCVRCPICTKKSGGVAFTFCWDCETEWQRSGCYGGCVGKESRLRILATCPTKRIGPCGECPTVRGCLNCGLFIEHKDQSAHMNCSFCNCAFCFICLREKKDDRWACHWAGTCKLAPRQTTLP